MQDPRFRKTVNMITFQHDEGCYGLCLNRPSHYSLQDIVGELGKNIQRDLPLYWGGPVSPQTIWMLHDNDWATEVSIRINRDWSMTSHISMFDRLVDDDYPKQFRIFYGFCSWAENQLEAEIEGYPPYHHDMSWLVWHQPHDRQLLEIDVEDFWAASTEQCGKQTVSNWMT
jgi:putative transcriptional regulator